MMALPKILFAFALAVFVCTSSVSAEPALTIYRPGNNVWYTASLDEAGGYSAMKWGVEDDMPIAGDFDGDGKNDIAVWRPSTGMWYISRSSDGTVMSIAWGMTTQHPTGGLSDVPVAADYDGDGITDIAVWRPDTGIWYVIYSSENFDQQKAGTTKFGQLGDIPVLADYDGDGLVDLAVFRSMENRWYISNSESGKMSVKTFGLAGYDVLVPADYTGDGKADIAVFRNGIWWILDSTTDEVESVDFGFPYSIPVPADYDGDGTVDIAVFHEGQWYIQKSVDGSLASFRFGVADDVPLNSLAAKPSMVGIP